jgi:hypothetical protein
MQYVYLMYLQFKRKCQYHCLLAQIRKSLTYPHFQHLLCLSELLVIYVLHARRIGQNKVT